MRALLVAVFLAGCTPHAAPRLRSALDVLKAFRQPAQDIAERACVERHGDGAEQCARVHEVFEAARVVVDETAEFAGEDSGL
jgi:hypothetical protein